MDYKISNSRNEEAGQTLLTVFLVQPFFTQAIMRNGPPLPFFIFMGNATISGGVGGLTGGAGAVACLAAGAASLFEQLHPQSFN